LLFGANETISPEDYCRVKSGHHHLTATAFASFSLKYLQRGQGSTEPLPDLLLCALLLTPDPSHWNMGQIELLRI